MTDPAAVAAIFDQATQLNREDPLLRGSLLMFPDYGQVVMTGDLHGHRRNFEKLKKFCALEYSAPRHVILHEIIHEDVEMLGAPDTSYKVLLDAARWKIDYPDQVHFLLSNHELAQLNDHEITKSGRVVTRAFSESVVGEYGSGGTKVLEAINTFIRSFALAGRTPNRVFLAHSIPGPRELPLFDPSVLSRALTEEDLQERGSAHGVVWGRYHTEAAINTLTDLLDSDFFVCGHQPQEEGYSVLHDRLVLLASEHNHGVFLPLDLSKPVTLDRLTKAIRPFAGVM